MAALAKTDQRWMWAVVPFYLSLGPLGTLIPLYLLKLGGTAITVGLAITLYNGVTIPASIIWGLVVDFTAWRRKLILMSYGTSTALLFFLYFARDALSVAVIYAGVGFFSTASSTPLNLLVMETAEKRRWPSAFSLLNLLASAGTTAGLIFATAYTAIFSLRSMMVFLSIFAASSVATAALTVKDPPVTFERRSLSMHKDALSARLAAMPYFFLRLPRPRHFYRFAKERWKANNPIFPLYVGLFAFYIASGLFNTMITPGLYRKGLNESQVFMVIMTGYVIQTLSFYFSGRYIERVGEKRAGTLALFLRSAGYIGIAASFVLFSPEPAMYTALVLYPLAAGFAYATFYAASNVLVFKTLGTHAGSNLGIYSSLVAAATLLGSFISGYTSYYIGYYFTYLLAGAFLLVCAKLMSMVNVRSGFKGEAFLSVITLLLCRTDTSLHCFFQTP
ncbi:MAG: MFS transporter [Thermoprotei archaeon]